MPVFSFSETSREARNSLLRALVSRILSSSVLYPSWIIPPSVRTCGGSSTIAPDMRCVNAPRSKRRKASPCKASLFVPSTRSLSSGMTSRDSAKATRSLAFAPPVPMRTASLSKSRTRDRTRLTSSRVMTSPVSSSTASSLLVTSAKSCEGRSIHFRSSLPPIDVTV